MSESRGTVLVVDDEKRIRELYSQYLGALGFEVQACGDGFDAVAAIDAAGDETFAAVIMDLKMAHVDGRTAIDAIRDMHPPVPIIVVSGFVDEEVGPDTLAKADRVLKKPVDFAELEAAICELQEEGRAGESSC